MAAQAKADARAAAAESGPSEGRESNSRTVETSAFTICVRIRPVLPHDLRGDTAAQAYKTILKGTSSRAKAGARGRSDGLVDRAIVLTPTLDRTGAPKLDKKVFKFDHVWGARSTDLDIYDDVGRGMVESVLAGRVCCIFAYGQTGSGKTHTMTGVVSRVAQALFGSGAAGPGGKHAITFSFFEILGTRCTDCLGDFVGAGGPASVSCVRGSKNSSGVVIGEDLTGAVVTRNLTEHAADTLDAFNRLIEVAAAHRTTRSTERNATSSRSHAVCTVRVARTDFPPGAAPEAGILRIIDLAGSERASDSKAHDKATMKETKAINASLMSLKDCIRARTKASKFGASNDTQCHVPYRRNRLTLLMKDVFDIGCRRICSTVVVANVSPLALDVAHSKNTMGYAAPLRVAVQQSAAAAGWEKDELDPAGWDHAALTAWVVAKSAELGMPCPVHGLCPGGVQGAQLVRMPEADFLARCVEGGASAEEGQRLYGEMWQLAVDAKTRKRRPDGSIVTTAELAAEAAATEAALQAHARMWDERTKAMSAARDAGR